MPVGYEV
ncbi:unnamed protein product [Callosobruchus maculatus]|nr:unnamed protein product [Callosobruchus maculatus]